MWCRSTGSWERSTTSRTSPISTAARFTSPIPARSAATRCSTSSPRRPTLPGSRSASTAASPTCPLSLLMRVPPLPQLSGLALRELGIPEQVLAHVDLAPTFDTREAERALKGSALERPPPLHEYAPRLWDYWEREMDDLAKASRLKDELQGKHVLLTGASSGIGRATALKLAAAGAVPLLVARNVDKLEEVRAEIVAGGGTAYVYAGD